MATIMAMPVTIDINETNIDKSVFDKVFEYLRYIDNKFSTYKNNSEIEKINRKEIHYYEYSKDMKTILKLSEKTKKETNGYFDIKHNDKLDPSGIVKGFAIHKACQILKKSGYKNYYIEIAGDIEISGLNQDRKKWRVGIENPFSRGEIIKVLELTNKGIATSGKYIRGEHIWNNTKDQTKNEAISITVISNNVYNADRFATAAFAMGEKGILFIEKLKNTEGYMVMNNKKAIFTSGFEKYQVA